MNKNEILNKFSEVSQNRYEWIRKYVKSSGEKAIGYLCSYIPEELLHAAGFLPVRIWGDNEPVPQVNAHLQTYCCFIVKSSLSLLLNKELNFLHGTLFSHSCDSLQCLSDIWEINSKFPFHETFNMPTRLDNEASLDYLVEELNRIKQKLESLTQKWITMDELRTSCRIYNDSRESMRKLYRLRLKNPHVLTNIDMNNIVNAASVMPMGYYLKLLESLLNCLSQGEQRTGNGYKLFIVGSIFNDYNLYQLIEEINGIIVDDDLCNGSRYFEREIKELDDPILGIAESLRQRINCPCKYNPYIDRGEYLVKRVKDSGACGVIFYLYKYCEPHFFDYPYLKAKLDEELIPALLVEAEKPGYNLGQIKSRLQAFVEMLVNE